MERWLVFAVVVGAAVATAEFKLGAGIADVTGPIAGITLMGYGDMEQQGTGLHLRQWSRAFAIEKENSKFVFVNVDCAMMSDGVRIEVVRRLKAKLGNDFHLDNVMISATHSHSGVGGYLMHTLFDLPSFGFSIETYEAMVSGIVKSIERAVRRMQPGNLFLKRGRVEKANINRSPTAYEANPEDEKAQYADNVDKELTQLQFISSQGAPIGVINWFAVHPTSMNRSNTLVSSDNVGYASILFEQKMNPGNIIGKGPFVAAFASSNLGDVSPNVMGPLCHPSGLRCSDVSACASFFDSCFALGPGKDMFQSTKIIGERIFNTAWNLWTSSKGLHVQGDVRSVHQYVDMPSASVEYTDPISKETKMGEGCLPAMGYSFAAGTIDGPFAEKLVNQGTTWSNPIVNLARNILGKPSEQDSACHAPKPILLFTGGMTYPFDWQPRIVSTQVALIGNVALACVPGEFTTMSGRRMRKAVEEEAPSGTQAILVGLCNTYSDYITTYEEYQIQRYEGGSTLYGPHTLAIYLQQYRKLTQSLVHKRTISRGPEPFGMNINKTSFIMPVVLDSAGWNQNFGDVLQQPPPFVQRGDLVKVSFVAGHPRNNLMLDDTYVTVEHETAPGEWKVVATDANWETRFRWAVSSFVLGRSRANIEYSVPDTASIGTYRIKYYGHHKSLYGPVTAFSGTTEDFEVVDQKGKSYRHKWWMNLRSR